MKTYPLSEVAREVCGDDLEHPELWLLRLVKSKAPVTALRISRGVYRFTDQQKADLVAYLETGRVEEPPIPSIPEPGTRTLTLTPRSARTLRSIGGAS